MRVLLLTLLAVTSTQAYDAVIFSNVQKISEDHPTFENILSAATPESPVLLIENPDFNLGQFSLKAATYSKNGKSAGIANVVQKSQSYASRYFDEPVIVPTPAITELGQFALGKSVYVIAGEDWSSMEELALKVLAQVGDKYTAVITATEGVSQEETRVKRVALLDENEEDAAGATGAPVSLTQYKMPVLLPPYNRSDASGNANKLEPDFKGLVGGSGAWGNCMFYLEGLNIVVQKTTSKNSNTFISIPVRYNNSIWKWDDSYVSCPNTTVGNYTFEVNMQLTSDVQDWFNTGPTHLMIKSGSIFHFVVSLSGTHDENWQLTSVELKEPFTVSKNPNAQGSNPFLTGDVEASASKTTNINNIGMQTARYFSWACSVSQAAFFDAGKQGDNTIRIGIGFYNVQLAPFGIIVSNDQRKIHTTYFPSDVYDCVGTFSSGSWMAIVSILVLLFGFFFGYLMLNAVQTMDRFDDPKQKQIVINVRE